jgi:hypothetical protein
MLSAAAGSALYAGSCRWLIFRRFVFSRIIHLPGLYLDQKQMSSVAGLQTVAEFCLQLPSS